MSSSTTARPSRASPTPSGVALCLRTTLAPRVVFVLTSGTPKAAKHSFPGGRRSLLTRAHAPGRVLGRDTDATLDLSSSSPLHSRRWEGGSRSRVSGGSMTGDARPRRGRDAQLRSGSPCSIARPPRARSRPPLPTHPEPSRATASHRRRNHVTILSNSLTVADGGLGSRSRATSPSRSSGAPVRARPRPYGGRYDRTASSRRSATGRCARTPRPSPASRAAPSTACAGDGHRSRARRDVPAGGGSGSAGTLATAGGNTSTAVLALTGTRDAPYAVKIVVTTAGSNLAASPVVR